MLHSKIISESMIDPDDTGKVDVQARLDLLQRNILRYTWKYLFIIIIIIFLILLYKGLATLF